MTVHCAVLLHCSKQAIVEKEDVKIDFYKTLGPLINSECIFASNTSSLAISNMAIASGRPDRFVGLHFFNPVQVMKLVEVISTSHTDPAVTQLIAEFGKRIGKVTVNCGDTPGFIVNRLLVPFLAQVCCCCCCKGSSFAKGSAM